MSRRILRAGTALAAAAVALSLSTGVAHADPDTVLPKTAIVGVGSDTTQYVVDALATAYNATSPAKKLGSWDAIPPAGGSTTITTKRGCASITRPNGGSAGVAALLADTTNCIDFARTISPKATDGSQNSLTFYAFGRDGVGWAHIASRLSATTLTTAQLAQIYTCQVTNWNAIDSALPSGAIHPKLPQAGSALRKTFLTRLGLTDATVGACVDSTLQQNRGTDLNGDKLALVPHSIASYVAQTTGQVTDVRGGITLGKINGLSPTVGNGANIRLNVNYDSNYLFLVYNVVKTARAASFGALFKKPGFICKSPSIISAYGFATIGAACGTAS
jgi:ABC-type phosphate transport system substrate-binding protein